MAVIFTFIVAVISSIILLIDIAYSDRKREQEIKKREETDESFMIPKPPVPAVARDNTIESNICILHNNNETTCKRVKPA